MRAHRVVLAVVWALMLTSTAAAGMQLPEPDDVASGLEEAVSGTASTDSSDSEDPASDGDDGSVQVSHQDGTSAVTGEDSSSTDGAGDSSSGDAMADDGDASEEAQGSPAFGVLFAAGALLVALIMGRRLLE